MSTPTNAQVFSAIARSLREFGYSDASAADVQRTFEALADGSEPTDIVEMFAARQLRELLDAGWLPK